MSLLDIVILILILSWAGGLSMHVAGSFIHLLLLIALATLIYRVATGRKG